MRLKPKGANYKREEHLFSEDVKKNEDAFKCKAKCEGIGLIPHGPPWLVYGLHWGGGANVAFVGGKPWLAVCTMLPKSRRKLVQLFSSNPMRPLENAINAQLRGMELKLK